MSRLNLVSAKKMNCFRLIFADGSKSTESLDSLSEPTLENKVKGQALRCPHTLPPPSPSPTHPSKCLSLLAGLMLQRTDQIFLSKSCCSLHDVRCSTLAMQTDAVPVSVLARGMRHDSISDTMLSFLISRCPVRSCPVSTSCPAQPSQLPALPTPAPSYPFVPCFIHFCLPSILVLSCLSLPIPVCRPV